MRSIHAEFNAAFGSRRMNRELQGRGHRIGPRRVERFMREHGIRARHKRRRFKATTDSRHSLSIAPNLLARSRLTHGYMTVDLPLVWKTAREDLPSLAQSIAALLSA